MTATPELPRDAADDAASPTAPTEPLGSGASAPTPFVPERPAAPAPADAGPAAAGTVTAPATAPARAPWYRRGWVLGVGAAVLALLAFTSGFVAGTATNLVNSFATQTAFGDHDGDGDGFGRPGPGAFPGQGQPGRPGGPGQLDDGDQDSDVPGQYDDDGTTN